MQKAIIYRFDLVYTGFLIVVHDLDGEENAQVMRPVNLPKLVINHTSIKSNVSEKQFSIINAKTKIRTK